MYINFFLAKSVIRFRFPFLSLYKVLAQRAQVNSTNNQTMHAIGCIHVITRQVARRWQRWLSLRFKYFKRLFTQAMDDNSSRYFCWKVPDLEAELIKRGAVTTGRKQDLIERLIFSLNMSFSSKLSQVAHSILAKTRTDIVCQIFTIVD